jgi:hypothetical protein
MVISPLSHRMRRPDRVNTFDRWASERTGVRVEELTTEKVMTGIPQIEDLPDGPLSDVGGQVPASELESPTESELRELASLGDELLEEFPAGEESVSRLHRS